MSDKNRDCRKVIADIVEAGAIRLVDENGKTRAELMCRSDEEKNDGFVVVHMYDDKGRPRLSLQVNDKEGPSVALFNGKNSPCVSLGVFEDRGNGVTVCDGEGIPRFSAGTRVDESTSALKDDVEVEIRDDEGRIIWSQPE